MADYCAILKNANPGAPRRALALHRRAACSTWRAPLPRARARRGFLGGRAGLGERIEVVRGRVEEVALPEACDVLVSEPMGTLLVNERMLETYLFARDHLLKPGGRMFPARRPSRAPPARAGATHGARGVRGGARRTQRSAPPGPRAASRSWRGTGGVVPGRACARRRRPDAAAPRARSKWAASTARCSATRRCSRRWRPRRLSGSRTATMAWTSRACCSPPSPTTLRRRAPARAAARARGRLSRAAPAAMPPTAAPARRPACRRHLESPPPGALPGADVG